MKDEYAAVCGITKEELFSQMQPEIQALADNNNMTYEEACAALTKKNMMVIILQKSHPIFIIRSA